MEKIEKCIREMTNYPNIFYLTRQVNNNIIHYFDSKFNLKKLPMDFLLFISIFDGLKTDYFNIFSIYTKYTKNESSKSLTFYEQSTEEVTLDYLEKLNIYLGTDLFFFADDGKDGKYALKKMQKTTKYFIFRLKINQKSLHMKIFQLYLKIELDF